MSEMDCVLKEYGDCSYSETGCSDCKVKAKIRNALSVQPEPCEDAVSRQAAIDEIDEWIKAFRENGHKESAADACLIQDGIIQLPSAQPEIIRCRDCKHYNAGFECLIEGYGIERSADWYCGDAERRENDKR